MNIEELKAALDALNADSLHGQANLDTIRESVMESRARFKLRDFREIGACVFVFAGFFAVLSFDLPWMTQLGAMIYCCAAIFVGTSIYLGRRRHRVFPELSVHEFLEAEIAHLDYQIQLLRNVSWWYLAPLAVGFLMFVWGLLPQPAAAVVTVCYFLLDRTIYWLNQQTIQLELKPQREKLVLVYQSLNELVEVNPNSNLSEE